MYKIKIGEGSCGISAGAGKIHKLLDEKATGIIRFTRSDASGCAFSSPLSIYMMAIRS